MKKQFIIILIIQTVLIGLFFIYAFIQKMEVDKQTETAQANFIVAQQQEKLAKEYQEKAEQEINKLLEELKKCDK